MSPGRIILTCGEPAGIGPELAPLALASGVDFAWMGDPRHLPAGTAFTEIAAPGDPVPPGRLPVLSHDFAAAAVPGQPDPANAASVIAVIARAADLVMRDEAAAICTLPISKQALKEGAGFAFPGHTEYLAHLAAARLGQDVPVAMMLASTTVTPPCRVVPATIHIPLQDVPAALTGDLLEQAIRITHAALIRDFGIRAPRLAVAGLNPHAGEGGTIGRQETAWMVPLLQRHNQTGKPILPTTDLASELNIDSVAAMDLIMELEERFDIDIPINLVSDLATVADLAGLVERQLKAREAA